MTFPSFWYVPLAHSWQNPSPSKYWPRLQLQTVGLINAVDIQPVRSTCRSTIFTHGSPQSVMLKLVLPENIFAMVMALDTSHDDRSTLNLVADSNVELSVRTSDTSHAERSASKFIASANVLPMFVTLETSQAERSDVIRVLKNE
jgi:hypothetical protein